MKILDILRKLGILRTGSTSWKGDAKDRPVEMMLDNSISSDSTQGPNDDSCCNSSAG